MTKRVRCFAWAPALFGVLGLLVGCVDGSASSSGSEEPPAAPSGNVLLTWSVVPHHEVYGVSTQLGAIALRSATGSVDFELPNPFLETRREQRLPAVISECTSPSGQFGTLEASLRLDNLRLEPFFRETLTIVDPQGLALSGWQTYRLELPQALQISGGAVQALHLRLDLRRSLRVEDELAFFEPVIEAWVDGGQTVLELEGSLLVDPQVNLRTLRGAQLSLAAVPSTSFELDGALFSGDAGLATLAGLPGGFPLHATGTLSADGSLHLKSLRGGISTLGSADGYITMIVPGKLGPTLQVSTPFGSLGVLQAAVRTDETQTLFVSRIPGVVDWTPRVGQRVTAFGLSNGEGLVDATNHLGAVRLHSSEWLGRALTGIDQDLFSMDVERIGPFLAEDYNWSSSGSIDLDQVQVAIPPDSGDSPFQAGQATLLQGFTDSVLGKVGVEAISVAQPAFEQPLLRAQDKPGGRATTATFGLDRVQLIWEGPPGSDEEFVLDYAQAGQVQLPLSIELTGVSGHYSIRSAGTGAVFQTTNFEAWIRRWEQEQALGAKAVDLQVEGLWVQSDHEFQSTGASLVVE